MLLNEYIENHKDEIVTIPMEKIALVSKIHQKGIMDEVDTPSENLIAIVRPRKEGGYALVMGWNAYMNAKHRGLENLRCIITKDTRGVFIRKNTTSYPVGKILIEQSFVDKFRSPEKVQHRVEYYQQHGEFEHKVKIEPNGKLYDGYATFLAAQQLGLKRVPVHMRKR